MTFIVGLDLGQSKDPSALALIEQTYKQDGAHYACRHLRRWHLGTPYPQIVEDVLKLTSTPLLRDCTLAVDGTGCGRAVVDLFRHHPSLNCAVRPILITAGYATSEDGHGYLHVAKIQLVSVMKALSGHERFKFAPGIKLARVVELELATFTAKITPAGSETFAADWREQAHDDCVLAVALTCWLGETHYCGPFEVSDHPENRTLVDRLPPDIWAFP